MDFLIKPITDSKEVELDIQASDKSISHRVCMFALFADSTCRIKYFLNAEDTHRSLTIAHALGLRYTFKKDGTLILQPPKDGLEQPNDILYCGNSGTSMRLYAGLLAGANVYAVLCGDKYLHARPMGRIIDPLCLIGANIQSRKIQTNKGDQKLAPLSIIPTNVPLEGFRYHSEIASAQVKSAMILAGLQANKESFFSECSLSRNHTENMLSFFQKSEFLACEEEKIKITPFCSFNHKKPLHAFDIAIPNDPSSAFFFAVLACITPNLCLTLRRVMMNETRIGAFRILEQMGANIVYENITKDYETIADITVRSAELKAVEITENIAWLIDEIPALSIACAMAKGVSKIRNAVELRVKESDRISTVLEGLKGFGVQVKEYDDGFDVVGGTLQYGSVDSKGDHRIAMSFAIAACVCGGEILDCDCVQTSFPNFFSLLGQFTEIMQR